MNKTKATLRDINKIPTDGYLIFPISMSRITNAQSPEECYKALQLFEKKVSVPGVDVIFLYTNGLYYNNEESALSVRKKTNQQMIDHRNGIMKLIKINKKYVPQAFHFIPWDYILLNSLDFTTFLLKLKKLFGENSEFASMVKSDLKGRPGTEANISFLLEEIALNHVIRERLVDLPKTLVKQDTFRLFLYPGEYMKSDLYQWKKKILPQKQNKKGNSYFSSQYDLNKKVLYDFEEMDCPD